MSILLKGAPVAAAITERLKQESAALRAEGIRPCLAIVRVGAREDDLAYERGAVKRCFEAGVEGEVVTLPANAEQAELLEVIEGLNQNPRIHGVLLFRPLPKGMDEAAVCRALAPEKDVDGITPGSMAGVFSGTRLGFPPCTAQACVEILDHYGIDPTGKRAVVVGRSLVVGRPAAMLLLGRNATVTLCHTKTLDLPAVCREGEILLVAAGKAGSVGKECFRPGQIVLDVGIHVGEDGKLRGDVEFNEAESIADAVTPVPGGVGTVTSAVLASHVIEAAKRRRGSP